jgi:NAD(P)H-hydrate epimerase
MLEITKAILKEIYKERPKWSHKGDYGKLLIIGGSKKYTGAPALAGLSALAALRSGVDLVTIAAPKRAADIIASFSPNLITEPLEGDFLTRKHTKFLLKLSKDFDAISIGSGLGKEKETFKFVLDFIGKTKKPCVIDADAIKALKRKRLGENFVLTPHSYEFYSLSGEKPKIDLTSRIRLVEKFARRINCVILLKGAIDIISNGKRTRINRTGNPYMTTGGTGDVLTGVCGSLLSQGIDPFRAACASAYITGRAGDFAAKEKRQGLIATDIIEQIPKVIR